jgi:hypothetical protein
LLVVAAGLAAVAWSWQIFGVREVNIAFDPIPGLEGWKSGLAGDLSAPGGNAADAVFLGIGTEAVEPLPEARLCATLFARPGPGTPVAVFTDAYCPNCRLMDPMLAGRGDLAVTWHDLPLLGEASETAARALAAAELQNGTIALREEFLKTGFAPVPSRLARAATAAGLDAGRLIADMDSPAVAARLAETRAAAQALGIWGTPAIVVGKSVVLGRLRSDGLDRLLSRPLRTCGD